MTIIEPIEGLTLESNPESQARANLDIVFHRIEWSEEAFENINEYREALDNLKDEKRAIFEQLVEAYKTGDLEACYAIGCAYSSYNGGVKRNLELAHAFFLQAAKAGHPKAMTSYAYICRRSNDHQDTPEVIEWLMNAANAGDTSAMRSVAFRYLEGDSLEVDYEKAEYWLQSAYNKGGGICAYDLGKLYEFYLKDDEKAYQWYLILAEQHPKNFRDLARFLNQDNTKYFDPAESLRLKIENWKKCIEISRPVVCGEIAEHYLNGRGVDASKDEALKWLRKKLELLKPDTKLARETQLEISELEGNLI